MVCTITISFAQNKDQNAYSKEIDGWKNLTLREKIGQLMIMLPDRNKELVLGNGSLKEYFKKYPVSGYFMGWKLFQNVKFENRLAFIKSATIAYQAASTLPLIFQQDYENGINLPEMTSFPTEMTIGAANSPKLAFDYGKFLALEAKSVGVTWVLHPMADLNLNYLNPIVNVRSISSDPDKAIKLLSQQIKGLQQNGVVATIKHFPGDGVDNRDQHLTTTSNSLSVDEWKKNHGKVFQALIDSGVACIMPGHITFPAYQKNKINGMFPPATLSKELITDLLKGEMHFKGVVISDAMLMGGFRGWYPTTLEGEIQCFLSGTDMLLWPSYQFMDTLEYRIKAGKINIERLNDAVKRVWEMKYKFGLLKNDRKLIVEMSGKDKLDAQATASILCESAVTLVRDRNKSIPFDKSKTRKILIVAVTTQSRKGGDGGFEKMKMMQSELIKRGFEVDLQRNMLYETNGWEEQLTQKYDKIIFGIARYPHAPFGPLELYDDEAQTAWGINSMPKDKLIVVSFGSPYTINQYFERVHTCINAYSNNQQMHQAVVKVLMGEIQPKGTSPVDLLLK